MAFIVIGGLGFIWMGLWMFLYKKPNVNPRVNAAELEYIEQDNNNPEESKAQQAAANDLTTRRFILAMFQISPNMGCICR